MLFFKYLYTNKKMNIKRLVMRGKKKKGKYSDFEKKRKKETCGDAGTNTTFNFVRRVKALSGTNRINSSKQEIA